VATIDLRTASRAELLSLLVVLVDQEENLNDETVDIMWLVAAELHRRHAGTEFHQIPLDC
jgi:hypothetical protein